MSVLKKTIICVVLSMAVCTVMYCTALFALPNVIDLNKYKDDFSAQIEKESGFKVSCENIQFKRNFSPYLKIYMYHTIVLYPDESVFLKIKEADLRVKILPLLFKKVEIKDAQLTRPIINFTLYEDFTTSFEKYIDMNKTFKTNGFNLDALISDTLCKNYKLKIFDYSVNKEFYLEGDELLLKNLKLNESAHIIIKGALFQDKKEYLKYDLNLITLLNNEKKPFTFSPFKSIYESDLKGNITGNVKINKNKNITGNVQINDLSIKVDDTYLKNNSANLVFKGEEVQINSVLHTSLKDKVELNGKFSYGKKRLIDMHVSALNINLATLSKITSELTKALNIENPIKDMKIQGLLNADFSVNSDFKKLKSKGSAKIKNALVKINELPYNINQINADVNFNDNKIKIENAELKVNSTPVKLSGVINQDVTVDLKATSENLDIKPLVLMFLKEQELPVNILKGKLSFVSEIKGNLNKTLLSDTKINTYGLAFVEKTQKIPVSINDALITLKTDKNKYFGDVEYSGSAKYKKSQIIMKDFGFSFNEKEIKIPQKEILFNSSPIKISGVIKNYLQSPDVNINYNADINSKDMGLLLSDFVKEPYKALGIIKTDGNLIIKDNIAKIKAQLKANKDNYISYLVIKEILNKPSILAIDAEIKDKTVTIKDLSLAENKENASKILNITGEIINEKTPVFKNLRVQIPSSLSAAMNFFGGEEISLNADLTLNNTIDKPKITGSAKIHKYNIKKYLTSIKNADVNFGENNIKITAPDVVVNDSAFNVILDAANDLNFKNVIVNNAQVNSLNLDLNSLFSLQSQFDNLVLTVKKGSAVINNFKVLDLKAKDIVSDFKIENSIIKLSNINASAYSGQVQGKIDYNIRHHNLDINMTGKGLDVKTSLYDLCKIEDNLGGRADFTADISLLTGTEKEVLKSLKGKFNYTAQNGKMGTLGKFEYYLYAKNLLYHGFLNTTLNRVANAIVRDNTSYFKESKGNLTFENGYLITDNLTTTGVNMSLYMTGRHNLLTNQANLNIYGRISDDIRNKLGSFGNVSISDMMNSTTKQEKKNTIVKIPSEISDKIPPLYKKSNDLTNTFKVNIYGDINSLNAINSFVWTLPQEEASAEKQEELPSFSEL